MPDSHGCIQPVKTCFSILRGNTKPGHLAQIRGDRLVLHRVQEEARRPLMMGGYTASQPRPAAEGSMSQSKVRCDSQHVISWTDSYRRRHPEWLCGLNMPGAQRGPRKQALARQPTKPLNVLPPSILPTCSSSTRQIEAVIPPSRSCVDQDCRVSCVSHVCCSRAWAQKNVHADPDSSVNQVHTHTERRLRLGRTTE